MVFLLGGVRRYLDTLPSEFSAIFTGSGALEIDDSVQLRGPVVDGNSLFGGEMVALVHPDDASTTPAYMVQNGFGHFETNA